MTSSGRASASASLRWWAVGAVHPSIHGGRGGGRGDEAAAGCCAAWVCNGVCWCCMPWWWCAVVSYISGGIDARLHCNWICALGRRCRGRCVWLPRWHVAAGTTPQHIIRSSNGSLGGPAALLWPSWKASGRAQIVQGLPTGCFVCMPRLTLSCRSLCRDALT